MNSSARNALEATWLAHGTMDQQFDWLKVRQQYIAIVPIPQHSVALLWTQHDIILSNWEWREKKRFVNKISLTHWIVELHAKSRRRNRINHTHSPSLPARKNYCVLFQRFEKEGRWKRSCSYWLSKILASILSGSTPIFMSWKHGSEQIALSPVIRLELYR